MNKEKICVVTDPDVGWFVPHAERLVAALADRGREARLALDYADVRKGDVAFYLSCTRITPPDVLARNQLNLIVHASALPKGRGFSPIVWQVLEGATVIPISMIEACEPVDSGPIYMQENLRLGGHELNAELRERLGAAIVDMCLRFVLSEEATEPVAQSGEPTWYDRRRPKDSRLDPNRSIADQFDLLRVVDNERYPAFFELRGRRFVLKIDDVGPATGD